MAIADAASIQDLMQLAAFGGGFSLDAEIVNFEDLKRLAVSAAKGNARLEIRNASALAFDELKTIAAFGKGCIFFS
ncbi:hypothetical protein [Paracoccus sp. TOH]|uniref:hypothetical protein n=1 Tax=Paracoccus sp. TOH TaxID=1263728 RepID=UPI0025B05AB2|nr:hypothetical protein [Paracoccus sp. TOH]WJS85333.1 hypothetical protein NBE95_14235 [Paracoccus sp. TOH]